MSKRKKLVLTVIAVVLVIGGVLGGTAIAAAQDDETVPDQQTQMDTLLDKVAQIYEQNTGTTLDTEALKSAFQQAGKELNAERQQTMLDKLVEDGVITQEQADEYQAWLEARPDVNTGPFNLDKGLPFGSTQRGFRGMQDHQGWHFQGTETATAQ